jgi:hypothetical protein
MTDIDALAAAIEAKNAEIVEKLRAGGCICLELGGRLTDRVLALKHPRCPQHGIDTTPEGDM